MKHQETITLTGTYTAIVLENGKEVRRSVSKNIITKVGYLAIAQTMLSAQSANPTLALGTGTNTPAVGDTDLQTPVVTNGRLSLSSAVQTTNTAKVKYDFFLTSAEVPNNTYTEVALFVYRGQKKLLSRATINIVKAANQDLIINYELQFS